MSDIFLLTALLGGGVLIYAALHSREGKYDFHTALDDAVPFVPQFIIPYFWLFPFVFFTWFVLLGSPLLTPYLVALTLGMYSAAFFWFFFPGKMHRPEVLGSAFSGNLVRLLYNGGAHANAFPSAHVFASAISSFYLSVAFPHFSVLWWVVGAAIALSTLLIRQHSLFDVLGGAVWAAASVFLAAHLVG